MNKLFGFIITRHVNSENTNNYWNNCVKLLRTFYPNAKIVIIDDNSDYNFVKAEFEYKNIEIIQSEFPKRGELLPYYYFLKHKFFDNAIIMHDSVFIHKRVKFEQLKGLNVLPLWHFPSDRDNVNNSIRIVRSLKNNLQISKKLKSENLMVDMPNQKWIGCYGVQCYINLKFLERIEEKYNITNMLSAVNCRSDRCCLERIFGCIFSTECPLYLLKRSSLFGSIFGYQDWGYSYDDYINHLKKRQLTKPVIKVWTGR